MAARRTSGVAARRCVECMSERESGSDSQGENKPTHPDVIHEVVVVVHTVQLRTRLQTVAVGTVSKITVHGLAMAVDTQRHLGKVRR